MNCLHNFWDLNITWYSEIPDFPVCFQEIALVIVPYLVFCIAAAIYLLCICQNKTIYSLPWTALWILKLVFCLILLTISVIKVFQHIYSTHRIQYIIFCSGAVRILSFILASAILLQHKKCGIKSSTLLFLFWLLLSICGTIMFRSVLLKVFIEEFPMDSGKFVLDVLYYSLIYCELFLSLFVDAESYRTYEKKSPLEDLPAFLFITFFWMTGLIFKSLKKLLTIQDFAPLSMQLQSGKQFERFNKKWELSKRKISNMTDDLKQVPQSLLWVCIKAFWPWFLYGLIYEIMYDLIKLVPALLLDVIINFIPSYDFVWKGYFYCGLFFVVGLLTVFLGNSSITYSVLIALQIKATFVSAIYRKTLKISNLTRRKYTSGELVNLIAVDVDKLFDSLIFFSSLVAIPLRMILTIVLLWKYLGLACLSGIGVIIIFIFFTFFIANISSYVQVKQMSMKDIRMKYVTELLNGIKVLKFWAWETAFMERITDVRNKEVHLIRKYQLCYAVSSFFYNCTPFLVIIANFTTYLFMDSKNILHPSIVFVSLNLLNNIKYVLYELPNTMSRFIQAKVSINRIYEFLISEEMDPEIIGKFPEPGNVLTIKDGTFSWNREDIILKNINLSIRKGDLVAVIGLVGSGKSSLLSACLGDMYKLSGSIDIQGSLAYIPQQAWIQNQIVRDNILFMKTMDRKMYDSIIESCCLNPDLKILPAEDMTEIGEKGINLSGGQKQRISLARAVYQDSDVYLFDDPLSAVDAHVGKDIFNNVIGNNGLLKTKTRILVTHNLSFLHDVDIIVCMEDGQIKDVGTYENLLTNNAQFAEFMQKHANSVDISEDNTKEGEMSISDVSDSYNIMKEKSINSLTRSQSSLSKNLDGKLIDDEKMEIGKVKRKLYLNYTKHAGFCTILFSVFAYISFQAFEIGANVWLSDWSSDSLNTSYTTESYAAQRNKRIGIYAVLGIGQAMATVLGTALLAFGGSRASRIYHKRMLEAIVKSPMSFFDTTPQGRMINRFSKDIDVVDILIPLELDGFLCCFCTVVGTIIVIIATTPAFIIAVVPLTILYYFLQKLYLTASRQIKRMESIRRSPVFSFFAETIQGVSCIKAYNVDPIFTKKFEAKVDEQIQCFFYWCSCNRWLSMQLGITSAIILLSASVLAVYNRNVLGAAMVGLSITYAISITESLAWLIRTSVELENQSVSVERIDEYSKLPSEASWFIPKNKPPDTWPENGVVQFANYSTKYREDLDNVLQQINLEILSGEKIGIVGRTGAGKSSVTLALFRIIESSGGNVTIDNIDIAKIGLQDLRSKLTIIPQEPVLFCGSLRFNLDPNNIYSDNELWTSLEHSHMKNFISGLKEGLEAEILEGGENLSVGQRQLLCLARALLKKTKILILDEATASVDVETDCLIQETIKTEFSDHTVITIAHRLNTIMDYDRVIVMDSGNIIETGKVSELLDDSDSQFYDMAKKANLI